MDINISSQNLQSPGYVPFSSASLETSVQERNSSAKGVFEDLLAKAAEQQTAKPSSNSRKAVIDKTDKLYEQCEALETFLIKNLISSMRSTVQKSELLDTGFAGKMYEDMLYDEYAKDFSKNAGLGFAELAYMELTHQRGKLIANHA
ncbi:rod-binding protein [Leadbettera azotonutricia]|uniref:Cell envelope rod binding protein n=1 Tax=Leadbettera azotonutricia (strain ATCC BAA-888 / DSM 13862 / ZAS-9) TaxID=545695 RepID=F5YAB4_LEAAZ|nr:rod-binding protein [Leadbettera azotonutricia]AEF83393.1 cell envelope rod binding protein [Leadbettera azotonutricia ZAS-9]